MNKNRRVFNGWVFLLTLLAMVLVKGDKAKASDYPVLLPDGETKISTVKGGVPYFLPTFKLIIENDGYYLFQDENGDDTKFILNDENETWFHYIGRSCYIPKGTYLLGTDNNSGMNPKINVKTVSDYEFVYPRKKYTTNHLNYDYESILSDLWENGKVKVIIDSDNSYETSFLDATICPLLYSGETLAAGMIDLACQDYQFWNVQPFNYCIYESVFSGTKTFDLSLTCMGVELAGEKITVEAPDLNDVDQYTRGAEITVPANGTKIINIKPEHDGDYIFINPNTIGLDYDDEKIFWMLNKQGTEEYYDSYKYNVIWGLDEYNNYYIEFENESAVEIKIIFAEVLDKKVLKMPETIQNTTGTETAGWLYDKIIDDVEVTLVTSMGEYNVDLEKARLEATMRNPNEAGYAETSVDPLSHGEKIYFIVYENGLDGAEITLSKIEITINDTTYKESQIKQNNNNSNTNNEKKSINNNKVVVNNSVIVTVDAKYKIVNNSNGHYDVIYQMPIDVNKKSYIIPATLKLSDGSVAKVTEIAANAFKKCKKIKKVAIGKNVEKLGKNAFKGCKNLKTITIKSTKFTKKSFGKNAFKGISPIVTFKCPKKQLNNYKKWIKKTGAPKTAEYKK